MVEKGSVPEYTEIRKDLQPWMKKAHDIIKDNNLLGRLSIRHKTDITLFTSYLAAKLIRSQVFDNTKFLNPLSYEAIIASFSRSPQEEAVKIDEIALDKKLLYYLDDLNQGIVKKSYLTLEERNRARAIELAVNSLCSQAMIFDEKHTESKFKTTHELLIVWAQTWKDKVKRPS